MLSRRLKQRLGTVAYRTAGALWRLAHPAPRAAESVSQIMILNLLRIGDTVVTLPALRALRRTYPRAELTLVVRDLTAPLVNHLPEIDRVIAVAGDNSRATCAELAPDLPRADLAVVLDTSPWVGWAARKAGARRVIGYDSLGRGFAATERVPAPPMWNVAMPDYDFGWEPPYQAVAWMELARRAGASAAETEDVVPVWPVPKDNRRRMVNWLESRGVREFVLVHPGSDASYRWPVDRWRDYIAAQDYPVVVGGAAFERELLESLVSGQPGAHLWCGEGDLADYGALLSLAQHVASVDTSAAHLAAAAGTPLTVLFGPGDPRIWGPRGNNHVHIVKATSDCVGCKAAACTRPTHECMESIHLDSVINSAKRLV